MADTQTTNLNLTKPEPGAAEDTWGISLNADLDTLDAIFSSSGTQVNLNPNQINFADGKKALFGTSNDLQIYHTGTDSIIKEIGTGSLYLGSDGVGVNMYNPSTNEIMAKFNVNSDVELYYNNEEKLATTSTGIDVTGTVVSDGLILDANTGLYGTDATLSNYASNNGVYLNGNIGGWLRLGGDRTGQQRWDLYGNNGGGYARLLTDNKNRLNVANNGDISFYEDTGTSQAFFWDASAEALGIGTTSPQVKLHVSDASAPTFRLSRTGTGQIWQQAIDSNGRFLLQEGASEGGTKYTRLAIDDGGDVSISSGNLDVTGTVTSDGLTASTSGNQIMLLDSVSGATTMQMRTGSGSISNFIRSGIGGSANLRFETTGNVVRQKIDSNGDISFYNTAGNSQALFWDASAESLFVGQTSTGQYTDTAGTSLRASGFSTHTRDGGDVLLLNRLTSDGSILQFRKDNGTVGSIGTVAGRFYIGNDDTFITFKGSTDTIYPASASGGGRDNAISLGDSGARFKDIYASNGTIQTSDRNEKQDIEDISEAETKVAVAAKGLLKKFRWKSAVADKGDDARIHFGIIAQDLQDAFTAEGLDAGDYGMFISSTWTEETTGEEQTRLGVRYSELLAFIIAAI